MAEAIFTARREDDSVAVSFDYETISNTAIAGRDYTPKVGTATIPKGEKSVQIPVEIKQHPKNSLPREFTLKMSNPSFGARLDRLASRCVISTEEDMSELGWGTKEERMFLPKYWTIDSQPTESCSIVSNGNTFTAYMTNRTVSGLAGVIWSTKDKYDHKGISFQDHTDLRNAKLWFDIELGDGMPDFNNEKLTPTLTLKLLDGATHYIPLYAYAEGISEDYKRATIKLDFSNLKSGPDVNVPVDTSQVDQFFFSMISEKYAEGEDVVPKENQNLMLKITLKEPDTGYTMMRVNNLTIPAHDVRMCTSYDDMYNLTPERVVDNCLKLGYRDMINHYNGMSHYYEFSWESSAWKLNKDVPVNNATLQWMNNYFALTRANGYKVINSISFELMSTVCPAEWVQHDWNDALAETGYTPPSWVLSPNINEGMQYIQSVINKIAATCEQVNQVVIIQIGEPWWWYNTATNLPCVYDYTTKVRFNEETGLYAQDMGTIYDFKTGTPYDEYVDFLRQCLGERVVKFGADLKNSYPNAKITLLPFLPSIIGNGIMEKINLPSGSYTPENFDFYCSECYDWLLQGKMEKSFQAITIPRDVLKFKEDKIHYLAGFVPDEGLAPLYGFDPNSNYREYLWKMIIGNIVLNEFKFPGIYQYIWAYPQVMHDSITVHNSQSAVFHMGHTALKGYLKDTPPEV